MLTFRRFTLLFFLLLLTLNFWTFLVHTPTSGFIQTHATILYILLISIYFGISFLMAFLPCTNFHHPVICTGGTQEKSVAITFDDGPDPVQTAAILDILLKHQVKAAFFCVGNKIAKNEDLVRRIIREGHLIGNHSFSHSKWFDLFSTGKMKKEMEETNLLIRTFTGSTPRFFRPPFGVANPMVSRALRQTKLTAVCWDIRSYDTMIANPEKIRQRIIQSLRPGSIILLHDHTVFSQQHLDQLIINIHDTGYNIQPLDHLLNMQAYA